MSQESSPQALLTPVTPGASGQAGVNTPMELPPTVALTPGHEHSPGIVSLGFEASPDLLLKERIGAYDLVEQIAHGGMGVVYRAHDARLGRIVALKTLRFQQSATADEMRRFYLEALAVGQFSHPNIVPIYEVGTHEGQLYFTMALARGTLSKEMAAFRADRRSAVALVEKVARAVHYAHGKGILHRDLKPSNILLNERGDPLVGDFGVAKFLNFDSGMTQEGQVLGTPAYMAPEQASGESDKSDARTDVWSLGVILYELLTGKRPFQAKGAEAVRQQISQDDPPTPRSLEHTLDRDLETIIVKCLEKSPADRYSTAEALADDLARWLREEPISARPRSWPSRAWRKIKQHSAASTAVTVLAVTAVALILVSNFNDPERPARAMATTLQRKRVLTLVGATGGPLYTRLATGTVSSEVDAVRGNTFHVDGSGSGMLELLPDPGIDRYRLRFEVRHDEFDTGIQSLVGVYFMHQQQIVGNLREHYCCQLWFSDLAAWRPRDKPEFSSVDLVLRRIVQTQEGAYAGNKTCYTSLRCDHRPHKTPNTAAPEGVPKPWREGAIEVRPESIRVWWEGQALGELTAEELTESSRRLFSSRDNLHPTESVPFNPRGGLGVMITQATAAFRNVRVEPLDD